MLRPVRRYGATDRQTAASRVVVINLRIVPGTRHNRTILEPEMQPDRMADLLTGIAIANIQRSPARHNPRWISDPLGLTKPESLNLTVPLGSTTSP
jgi:hypothetical protein